MDAMTLPRLREQAYLLGPRKSLVGVMCERADGGESDRPTFVILNAGIIHRVGPSRMNVQLARALAQAGYPALRFDLSGIGDSEPRADNLPPFEASLADIREAIDWLEGVRKVRRVVLVGLCSGANQSLLYGGGDPRVVGLVLLDPATPRTWGYYLRYYLPRMVSPRVWYNVLRGRHRMVRGLAKTMTGNRDEVQEADVVDLQSPEVRGVLERAYRSALDQRIQMLVALTSGVEDQHNYPGQILDAFPGVPFGDRLEVEYFDGAHHTFASEADRSRLFALVLDWAARAPFEGRAAPAEVRPAA